MKPLPRNQRRHPIPLDIDDPTPTPPPVAVALSPRPVPRPAPAPAPRAGSGAHVALALVVLLAAVAGVLLVVARGVAGLPPLAVATWRAVLPFSRALATRPDAAPLPLPPPLREAPAPPPTIRHDGYASIPGGVLFTPKTFTPRSSGYDLLLHFHGNTQVVRESAEVAGLDAAVAVVNLGIGSGPYEAAYAVPGTYEALLADIDRAVAQRGLPGARLRRVALSAWSAGYGAISTILDVRRGTDRLDAILMLDGIHCGWLEERPDALNPLQLAPFARAAKRAAAGEILFSITHSEIDPITYAGSAATASYLLEAAAGRPVERTPVAAPPPHLELRAAEGAVSKRLEKRMEPTAEARVGELHVCGYRGNTREHHMAHLLQMAATVLPELATRWQDDGAQAAR